MSKFHHKIIYRRKKVSDVDIEMKITATLRWMGLTEMESRACTIFTIG